MLLKTLTTGIIGGRREYKEKIRQITWFYKQYYS